MTDKALLLDLAERVEKATGPDRELDVEIATAMGWTPVPNPTNAGGLYGRWYMPDGNMSGMEGPPQFTASIDAAMTLVLEGRRRVEFGTYEGGRAWAYVHDARDRIGESDDCANEALALTAAALRAKAAQS